MEEKFKVILDDDEKIKWINGINTNAYTKKFFLETFLFGLFPPIAILLLGAPYGWLTLLLSILGVIPMWIGIVHFIVSLTICFLYYTYLKKEANNTFFCITDKRIIKRSGAFNNKFVHYSLKNVGTVRVEGGIFDRKDNNPSATLNVTVKDYHTNTDGNSRPSVLSVNSLENAYEAYKLLGDLTEGNNENLRIKIEE